jgi:hypothetical protein
VIGVPRTFERALRKAQSWVGRDGIEAVGEGETGGERCIAVFVSAQTPQVQRLPSSVDGVPVQVHDSGGPIEAQDAP